MLDWLEHFFGGGPEPERVWLHRKFHLSSEVRAWLIDASRTHAQRCEFAELLLKLDANPLWHSTPVLRDGAPPGMRWAAFGEFRAIFVWNPAENSVRIVLCV